MPAKRNGSLDALPTRWYRGADVPMRVIRKFARQVAERFHPEKIILFGSHAYGIPHADSDVDILVVMPCRNQIDQAVRIRWEVPAPFDMDLIVRKPREIKWRLAEGELFHSQILSKGKVLYEKGDGRVGTQSRGRLPTRGKNSTGKQSRFMIIATSFANSRPRSTSRRCSKSWPSSFRRRTISTGW